MEVHGVAFLALRVFPNAAIGPVNGDTDGIDLLVGDGERLDPLGDHGLAVVLATRAGNLQLVAAVDPFFLGHLFGNFNEWLRNQLDVGRVVLGPVMVVLGQPVGGADNIVTIFRRAVLVVCCSVFLYYRAIGLLGMEWVVHRAFYRLVCAGGRAGPRWR